MMSLIKTTRLPGVAAILLAKEGVKIHEVHLLVQVVTLNFFFSIIIIIIIIIFHISLLVI